MRPKLLLAPDETQTGWTSVHADGGLLPTYLFTTNRRIVLARAPRVPTGGIALFVLSFFVGLVLFKAGTIIGAIVVGLGGTTTGLTRIIRAPYRLPVLIDRSYPIDRVQSCVAGVGLLSAQSVTITFDDGTRWRLRNASRGVQSAVLPLMLRQAGFDVIRPK